MSEHSALYFFVSSDVSLIRVFLNHVLCSLWGGGILNAHLLIKKLPNVTDLFLPFFPFILCLWTGATTRPGTPSSGSCAWSINTIGQITQHAESQKHGVYLHLLTKLRQSCHVVYHVQQLKICGTHCGIWTPHSWVIWPLHSQA